METYQNASFATGASSFVLVTSEGTNDEARFVSRSARLPLKGGSQTMISGGVTLNVPTPVIVVEGSPDQYVNSSIKLQFNVPKSNDRALLTDLRARVLALFDKAVAEYNLSNGLVPTGTAVFNATPTP